MAAWIEGKKDYLQVIDQRANRPDSTLANCCDEGRSQGHSIFITELLIRNPGQQVRFFAATITQVSVSANKK